MLLIKSMSFYDAEMSKHVSYFYFQGRSRTPQTQSRPPTPLGYAVDRLIELFTASSWQTNYEVANLNRMNGSIADIVRDGGVLC